MLREKGERRKEKRCSVWNVLECGGSGREKRGKKEKKEKSKGTCVEGKKREKKKKEKRKKEGDMDEKKGEKRKRKRNTVCVWRIKKGKKNGIKIFSQQILNSRLLLANIGEKKIIFLERKK